MRLSSSPRSPWLPLALLLVVVAAPSLALAEKHTHTLSRRASLRAQADPTPIVSSTAPTPPAAAAPASSTSTNTSSNGAAADASAPRNPLDPFMGNVKIRRMLDASVVVADALFTVNSTVSGIMKVMGTCNAKTVRTLSTRTKTLTVRSIRSPTGVIIMDGDVAIINSKGLVKNATDDDDDDTSFLEAASFMAENMVVGGVKQWKLVRHDSFDEEEEGVNPAEGWSLAEVSSCTAHSKNRFLGGHCNVAEGPISKRFTKLPPHSHVRVSARYHMIDNWQGETAFLQLDDKYVWSEHSRAPVDPSQGLEMCGSALYPERRMSIPVEVTLPHSASFLEVAFGSKALSKNKGKEDPCARSFGVDDVMIFVK